ncbi:hypothetical protein GCM10007391_14520 [Alteromonas halophila]|uniref:histidine kinase n=2 Tax=Alteromonas halophila TaxID=516698 RepID=A0A918JHZ1_9ALTE|nr:hypothetical protein GCM10007391_14520 [Alteromonas halophila]
MRVIEQLHHISSDHRMTFEGRLKRLLDLGCELLGMEVGVVGYVVSERFWVLKAVGADNLLKDGDDFPMEGNYCSEAYYADGILAYDNILEDVSKIDPSFKSFPMRSYIAMPYFVDGHRYGTLNFASVYPREQPFSSLAYDYIALLSAWVSTELSRKLAISALISNQQELKNQNALFKQVNDLTGVGTWKLDVESLAVEWSSSLRKIFGMGPHDPIGVEDVLAFIANDDVREYYKKEFWRAALAGQDWTLEFEVLTLHGHRRWVESRSHPVMEKGKCVKIIGATLDITERVMTKLRLEEEKRVASEALEARSMFFANMSHEIRTPIHGVLGMLEALDNTQMDRQQRRFCEVASQSAKALLDIVNDVLDFSKIDAGEMRFEEISFSISEMVEKVVSMFLGPLKKKQLTLTLNTHDLEGEWLVGDPVRLTQILINLVNNAIKFTESGGITIAVNCETQATGGVVLKLAVSDTGVGIDKEKQASIFNPFHQVEKSTQRKYGGTGLGLAIVAQIVSHYKGELSVESEPGEGATFTVALPLKTGEAPPPSPDADQPRQLAGNGLSIVALVVEDNQINQLVIGEQLAQLGVQYELAENGAEGVQKMEHALTTDRCYDIVLMDCQMPVMDGYQACRTIRKMGAEAARIPIIALTANALADERGNSIAAGMNDFLTKPLSIDRLAACMRMHLIQALSKNAT